MNFRQGYINVRKKGESREETRTTKRKSKIVVITLQRIEESIFSVKCPTVQKAFLAILTSTYLLKYTRFTRLLRRIPSRTEYNKSSTPLGHDSFTGRFLNRQCLKRLP